MCVEKYKEDSSFKLRKFDLIKILPNYKEGYEYLKEVDSVALQQAVIPRDWVCPNCGKSMIETKMQQPISKKKESD